jgi:DNA polymerase-3 subunit epsilon
MAESTEWVAIDFETTGQVFESGIDWPNEPWQIGMVRMHDGKTSNETFDELIRVGERPFNPYAPGRHHELRDALAAAPTWSMHWPAMGSWLRGPLIAHNAPTEKQVFRKFSPMHTFGPWIDTLKLSRIAWPELPSHKLGDLVHTLQLAEELNNRLPGREAHDALYDAMASALLLEHLLQQPGWEDVSVEALCKAHPHSFYRR